MKKEILILIMSVAWLASCGRQSDVYDLATYGIVPDTGENMSPLFEDALRQIASESNGAGRITVHMAPGRYDFHPEGSSVKEYYISNHDQTNPKKTGIAIEAFKELTFNGNGAELVFHGRMLPIAVTGGENITLKNFSIDFENPHITQLEVVANGNDGITFSPAEWVKWEIAENGSFTVRGKGWSQVPFVGMAFEPDTRHVKYRTSDINVDLGEVIALGENKFKATRWHDDRLSEGTVVTARTYGRPAPGIFISYCKDITLENIRVHYAEGMGLLAQMSENITLDGFSVCLKGEEDPRYFTTQADATHFSGCKGRLISRNGLYENMMDDAINVHGTYLKVTGTEGGRTLIGEYMHPQTYGFSWGYPGDTILLIKSSTMEYIGCENIIESIEPADNPIDKGVKRFRIGLRDKLPSELYEGGGFGIENLTWTPEVIFEDNTIRNNRARGALFSTPKKVIAQNNIFDHTSGTGILLCGDCNGWYETGACRDVTIRRNTFINALTNMFQFTNAIISIYPEIPDLENQKQYFHSNIMIEENIFDTFDNPILYAKSVKGITFRNNTIRINKDYPAFHWNNRRFLLEHTVDSIVENNTF